MVFFSNPQTHVHITGAGDIPVFAASAQGADAMGNYILNGRQRLTKDAVLKIAYSETSSASANNGGNILQVYDADNWNKGINWFTMEETEGLNFVHNGNGFAPIKYSPSEHKTRTAADLTDVVLDINGIVLTEGYIYSSVNYADLQNDRTIVGGGAKVISSKGTGALMMVNGAGQDKVGYQYDQTTDTAFENLGSFSHKVNGTFDQLQHLKDTATADISET